MFYHLNLERYVIEQMKLFATVLRFSRMRPRERDFHTTARFQDNQRRTEGKEFLDQRSNGRLSMQDSKRRAGTDRNIQSSLSGIDTEEEESTDSCHPSCPALRNAGSAALTTVRARQVRKHGDPRWHSVWERPWNRRSVWPQCFMGDGIVPYPERYKKPLFTMKSPCRPRKSLSPPPATPSACSKSLKLPVALSQRFG
jgi:hypothetical protein